MLTHFKTIAQGIDVSGVVAELKDHPELWGAHPGRTEPDSPHFGVPDIWVRYRDAAALTCAQAFKEPHFPVFYPAWHTLPSLHPIVFGLMHGVYATQLGGILITKIPPGGRVKRHHDRGSWHAEFYNTKVYVGLQSNQACVNYCEDEATKIKAGEAVIFNNLLEHSVENRGETDRVTLIVCMRTER